MRILFTLTSLCLSIQLAAASQSIYVFNPKAATMPVKGERLTGDLPDNWKDDTTWARTWASYKAVDGDEPYFKIETTKVESGQCQIYHMLPDIQGAGFYRVKLRAKSPQGASITFGVRTKDAPYAFQSSTQAKLPVQFQNLEFLLPVFKNTQPIGFWINLADLAEVDIASLELSQPSDDELRAEKAKERYPNGEPINLARVSRFPQGLQSGWNLQRENSDGDQVQISGDSTVTGPSGFASMHLKAESGVQAQIDSAPFDPPFKKSYVLSLYVKGKGQGKLSVWGDQKSLAQKSFSGSADWQRLELPFAQEFTAKIHHMQLSFTGEIWIDALQVQAGDKATRYFSQKDCEVSLASPSSIRVAFDDESATVKAVITGASNGGTLKISVTSPYETTELAPIALSSEMTQEKEISFFQPKHPYGGYRVEAKVVDANGNQISSDNELVVYRLHRPRYWGKDAPKSPFGTHIWSTNRASKLVKAAGCNWVRLHDSGSEYVGWAWLEPSKGDWHFRDDEIKRYRKSNLEILGGFSTAPAWASMMKKPHEAYFDRFYEPKDMAAFENYVTTMAKRYKGVIDAWDVWNEPWGEFWPVTYDETKTGVQGYKRSNTPGKDFAKLMETAYRAAKFANPSATVLGFNTTDGDNGKAWTLSVADAAALKDCDVIAYHQYSSALAGFPGDALQTGKSSAIGVLADQNTGALPKPYWITEGSPLCGLPATTLYKHTLPFPNAEDVTDNADRMVRFVIRSLTLGASRVFLYAAGVNNYFGESADCRAVTTEEGYLDTSGAAHSAMAWLLEDTKFKSDKEVVKGVQAYTFKGKGRTVTVLIPAREHGEYKLPAGAKTQYSDLFGNPLAAGTPIGQTLIYAIEKAN